MAVERGQYRQMLLEQKRSVTNTETLPFPWYRIRFYIALILFVCYLLLDYSGQSVRDISSEQIVAVIQEDSYEKLGINR